MASREILTNSLGWLQMFLWRTRWMVPVDRFIVARSEDQSVRRNQVSIRQMKYDIAGFDSKYGSASVIFNLTPRLPSLRSSGMNTSFRRGKITRAKELRQDFAGEFEDLFHRVVLQQIIDSEEFLQAGEQGRGG